MMIMLVRGLVWVTQIHMSHRAKEKAYGTRLTDIVLAHLLGMCRCFYFISFSLLFNSQAHNQLVIHYCYI